jgi:hypothetical protein
MDSHWEQIYAAVSAGLPVSQADNLFASFLRYTSWNYLHNSQYSRVLYITKHLTSVAVASQIIGHRLQITKHLIMSGSLPSFAFCFWNPPPTKQIFPYSAHHINKSITLLTHEVNKYHMGVNITGVTLYKKNTWIYCCVQAVPFRCIRQEWNTNHPPTHTY